MQVILLKDVKGVGKAGQVAKVSDGYARNLLIPKKLAMEASEAKLKVLDKKRAQIEAQRALDMQVATELKEKLEGSSLTMKAKAGDGGRLFGAITSKDIAEALEKECFITLDKKKIELSSPIKTVGEHEVELKLFSGINAKLKLSVEAE